MQCGTERCVGAWEGDGLWGQRLPHRVVGDSWIPSPSRRGRRRRRGWPMASSATDEVGPVSLAARSCSVASVKPVFAQATLGTWALFPRHVLKDSRFASLTVDTQHGGERESGTRTERGTKERVGGVGAGGGRVGRSFFFLARLQAARAATQSRRSWASNAADPPTRGKSTTQLRPELVCFSLNHTQAPKSPDSQATCRLTQVATGQPSSRT